MQEDGGDDLNVIPETPDMEVARSPLIREEWAALDGPEDNGTPCEQPAKHMRTQGSKDEGGVADAEQHEAIVRKLHQAPVVPTKRRQVSLISSQATLNNRRKIEAAMRRGLLKAAENETPLPKWLHQRKTAPLGDFFARLRAELLAPERDQARISHILSELSRLNQQDQDEEDDAEIPERVAMDGEQDVAAVTQIIEMHLPAKDPIGDELQKKPRTVSGNDEDEAPLSETCSGEPTEKDGKNNGEDPDDASGRGP